MTPDIAVDSSVLVAIAKKEIEASSFVEVLGAAWTAIGWPTVFEVRLWMIRNKRHEGSEWLDKLVSSPQTLAVDFDGPHEALARDAYDQFGKGRHPAKLNYGDCMAYAVAKSRDLPLLFKGGDFGLTDIRIHPASVLT